MEWNNWCNLPPNLVTYGNDDQRPIRKIRDMSFFCFDNYVSRAETMLIVNWHFQRRYRCKI